MRGGSATAGGRRPPPRLYYGWVLVLALGVTETVSYGILSYAFPVFIPSMERELGWSRVEITGGFSLAMLVAGLAAIPAGRWLDRRGPRALMTGGSALAVAVLLAWSRTSSLAGFYLACTGLGLAMAAVLYEPAFALVASWFDRLRGRALTVLTFMGGFASVVFVPLATWLVEAHGWRAALAWQALVLAVVTIPLHALLLRRRPEDLGLSPDGGPPRSGALPAPGRPSVGARRAVLSPSFAWLSLAFGLSAAVTTGLAVHLIPLLLERGRTPAFAGAAMGMLGVMALPGRLVFTPLGDRFSRAAVTALIFALSGAGVGALLLTEAEPGVWAFVVLFGAGFGAISPARAALLADLFGRESYGSIGGVLAMVAALSRAAAPLGVSLLHRWTGGYQAVLAALLLSTLLSAVGAVAAGRARRGDASPSDASTSAMVRHPSCSPAPAGANGSEPR